MKRRTWAASRLDTDKKVCIASVVVGGAARPTAARTERRAKPEIMTEGIVARSCVDSDVAVKNTLEEL